ncbi:MAG: hypothetical protein ACJZ9G_01775 [Rhodospirillales bacterium]
MSSNHIINGHDVSSLFDVTSPPISFNEDHKNFIPNVLITILCRMDESG